MPNLLNNTSFNKTTFNTIAVILLIFFYYKLYLEFFIPITGDELNSILIYSSNIKTLFLKNYPGNVTFFHFLGYLKTSIFGYDLISYRSISFIFFILHFWILKKLNFFDSIIIIFCSLLIITNFSYYIGLYVGYVFSSFIFVTIFYLLNTNHKEKNNKLILLLLFVQFYDHLVNIYLVLPIILSLFFFSNKKKFFKEILIFFICPTIIFYTFSIILTGLAEHKITEINLDAVILYLINNFHFIFANGFNRIFFNEYYTNVQNFNIKNLIIDFYYYDKVILLFFLLAIITAIYNFKIKKNNVIFSSIIVLHLLCFFLVNKLPAPRIFNGFYCFYILIFLNLFQNNEFIYKIIKLKAVKIICILILAILIFNFNYLKTLKKSGYAQDITYKQNSISLKILEKNCFLENINFSEIQKRNLYFNYLNKCNKKFDLDEFLTFYRS